MAATLNLMSSPLYQELRAEYIDLLEDDPSIYVAYDIPELAQKTKEEYWGLLLVARTMVSPIWSMQPRQYMHTPLPPEAPAAHTVVNS